MLKRHRKLLAQFQEDFRQGIRGWPDTYLRHQPLRTSRLARLEDIYNSRGLEYDPHNPGAKILIGALGDKLIGIEDNRHEVRTAGSRAGKSVSIINNLLLTRASVFCFDPKAELAMITARRRSELGQRVYVLDPFDLVTGPAASFKARFNPLAGLTLDNPHIIEDAGQIADGLVAQSGQEKDPHWNERAIELLQLLILHTATDSDHENARSLVTVRALLHDILKPLDTDDDAEDEAIEYALECAITENAERLRDAGHGDLAAVLDGAAASFFDTPTNERGGIISTARRHTQFLDYPSMKHVLSGHDFDLRDLKRDPKGVSVFVCLPAMRMSTCSRWLRVLLNQLLDAMEREPAVPPAPVLAILDEFPVLGHMRQIQAAAGQIASFHVKLIIIIQDITQIKALYREGWETFFGNAGIWQFFGNTDMTTLDYMSKKLGKIPVETTDPMVRGKDDATGPAKGRHIITDDLMSPEECARFFARNDRFLRQLVFWADAAPMIVQRVEYFDQRGPFAHVFAGTYDSAN